MASADFTSLARSLWINPTCLRGSKLVQNISDRMAAMRYQGMTLYFLTSVTGIANANLGVALRLAGYIPQCNTMMEAK
jgi:hypothetical protein